MLLLRTTGLEHVVPIVRDNLELIALYRQIKSNLGRNEEYRIFAEPSIDRFKKQISWYTEYEEEFSPLRVVFTWHFINYCCNVSRSPRWKIACT